MTALRPAHTRRQEDGRSRVPYPGTRETEPGTRETERGPHVCSRGRVLLWTHLLFTQRNNLLEHKRVLPVPRSLVTQGHTPSCYIHYK